MKKHITQVKERNISFIPSQEQSYKRAMQNIWSSSSVRQEFDVETLKCSMTLSWLWTTRYIDLEKCFFGNTRNTTPSHYCFTISSLVCRHYFTVVRYHLLLVICSSLVWSFSPIKTLSNKIYFPDNRLMWTSFIFLVFPVISAAQPASCSSTSNWISQQAFIRTSSSSDAIRFSINWIKPRYTHNITTTCIYQQELATNMHLAKICIPDNFVDK